MRRAAVVLLLLLVFAAPTLAQTSTPTPIYCGLEPPTPTPELMYDQRVLNTAGSDLLAYWKLNNTSGTSATDYSGNARHGTYNGPTLNATTFTNGDPAPSFDGVNDAVAIQAAISGVFNGQEGSVLLWVKVANWADGVERRPLNLQVDGNNLLVFRKSTTSNSFDVIYVSGAVTRVITKSSYSPSGWFQVAATWSKTANQFIAYFNGVQEGSTQTVGTWAGALGTNTAIGSRSGTGTNPWYGNIAHVALWDTPLTSSQIAYLASVPIPPTPTPTPTCVIVPTMPVDSFWTEPTYIVSGTPYGGQQMQFSYRASAGQVGIAFLIAFIVFSLWAIFLILYVRRRKTEKRK